MKKVDTALEVIRDRILHGESELTGVPSERRLAEELGVSRKTVRLAFKRLMDEGELERSPDGKARPAEHHGTLGRQTTMALVSHQDSLPETGRWHSGIRVAVRGQDAVLRIVLYSHYGDAALLESLNRYDGVFLCPSPDEIPEWLKARIQSAPSKVVVLGQDLTDFGIPSITLFPVTAIVSMIEHLRELGHHRIDCLNTQGAGPVIDQRIEVWKREMATHGLEGELHSYPDRAPQGRARRLVRQLLRDGGPSAIYCTTGPVALGAMRGAYDEGLTVGKDVSICAVNDEGIAEILAPSLTSIRSPSRPKVLAKPVDWIISGREWSGDLLIEPQEAPLFIGESTCAPKTPQ